MSTGGGLGRYSSSAKSAIAALLVCAVAATALAGPAYSVRVESDSPVYEIGQTARFDVALLMNGRVFPGAAFKLVATFPDASTPVSLNSEAAGLYSYDVVLDRAGDKTLAVRALHPSSNAAMALDGVLRSLQARIRVIESRPMSIGTWLALGVLRNMHAAFSAKLEGLLTPIAEGSLTITVLDLPEEEDTDPPVFGESVPPHGHGFAITNDAYHPITVEVSDEGSGVASVLLYVGDDPLPHHMEWDGFVASYYPSEPWAEGMNTATIVAEDHAGNAAALVIEFMVDCTPPEFISFTPEETSDPTPTIIIVVRDELSGVVPDLVRLYVNGSLCPGAYFSDDAIYYTLTQPLSPGLHYIGVSATDFAGNEASEVFMMRVLR